MKNEIPIILISEGAHETIAKMNGGVILINCARGGLMDTEALIAGLEQKKIGGLGLDCFEDEEGIYHLDRRDDIISNRSMAYLRQFPLEAAQ
ncbi:MAG: hypothetical protein LUG93_07055 [Lachnospiraceae bacterium]|nr:hypothetical protein [Lachnospiraceae bacterium]